MDHDQADVTMPTHPDVHISLSGIATAVSPILPRGEVMPTLAEMERCATILPGALQLSPWGIVPTSPHDARLASLEADLARLLAENVRLAASNAVLQRGMQIIAAADVPEPAKPGIPARALGCHAQRIGLLTGVW